MSAEENIRFHTDTALADGLRKLFLNLEQRVTLSEPLKVYIAGGMAVHLYTGQRVTTDIDAEFAGRLAIPQDLVLDVKLEDGSSSPLYFDVNYNPMFALMHERYQEDSLLLELGLSDFKLSVLSPLDLAVSKVARFADNDKQDISRLAELGFFSVREFRERAEAALTGFVGGQSMIRINLAEAVKQVQDLEV